MRCGDLFDCYLRRPIFPQYLQNNQLGLLLRPHPDPGLAWLLARSTGEKVDILGPLGTGFALPDGVSNLLLVSDSQWLAPLLGQMERAIKRQISVTLAVESSRIETIYPANLLPPAVELQAATLDGSLGHRGPIEDLLPSLLRWADLVCAVGSPRLYQLLKKLAAETRFGNRPNFLYGLMADLPLPCGVGACFGCTLETDLGLQLVCCDGPVFDLTLLT
jgi:dihydroorotate dehydrogenase electron transfer subunit